jgi:hypothetical protein
MGNLVLDGEIICADGRHDRFDRRLFVALERLPQNFLP